MFADEWFLIVDPTYYFTKDGFQPHRFPEALLAGKKRLERNAAVRGQVMMWQYLLVESSKSEAGLFDTDNPKPNYQVGMAEWHQTEILANQTTGRVQVAVNGKLVHDYMDPAAKLPRRKRGPIGMQIHKAGTESEYRDISVEVDPKSEQLLTLKP